MRLEIVIDFVHLEDWWLSLLIAGVAIFIAFRWDSLVATYHSWTAKPVEPSKAEEENEDDVIAAVRGSKPKDPLQALQKDFTGVLSGKPTNINNMFDNFFSVVRQVMETPDQTFLNDPKTKEALDRAMEQEKITKAQRAQKEMAQWMEMGGDKIRLIPDDKKHVTWCHLDSKTGELEFHQPTSAEIKALSPPEDQMEIAQRTMLVESLTGKKPMSQFKPQRYIRAETPTCDDTVINHINPPTKTQEEIDKEFETSRDACSADVMDDVKTFIQAPTDKCDCEDGVCFTFTS